MSDAPYTRAELAQIGDHRFPERGPLCPRCRAHLPAFADLSKEDEQRIRALDQMQQIGELREITGCSLRWAKIWMLHPNGPHSHQAGPPCRYCGERLFTAASQQCLHCGWDWHDPLRPVQHVVKKMPVAVRPSPSLS